MTDGNKAEGRSGRKKSNIISSSSNNNSSKRFSRKTIVVVVIIVIKIVHAKECDRDVDALCRAHSAKNTHTIFCILETERKMYENKQ